ncbi:hypothetical protein BJ508DRAFT_226 [Ascobolus immersus RN42]|uniref:Uncharacterized protein n=1 Tax=Ascobolus immersus RN42 TaxID=1160509 RepID=A0A3N4IR41_ASCIM|nr:hypothetical protein BJ508DRAFT_226 [Ascobolus immersus RN42]
MLAVLIPPNNCNNNKCLFRLLGGWRCSSAEIAGFHTETRVQKSFFSMFGKRRDLQLTGFSPFSHSASADPAEKPEISVAEGLEWLYGADVAQALLAQARDSAPMAERQSAPRRFIESQDGSGWWDTKNQTPVPLASVFGEDEREPLLIRAGQTSREFVQQIEDWVRSRSLARQAELLHERAMIEEKSGRKRRRSDNGDEILGHLSVKRAGGVKPVWF